MVSNRMDQHHDARRELLDDGGCSTRVSGTCPSGTGLSAVRGPMGHKLKKKIRAGRRRERRRPIACTARKQPVDQPVYTGLESESATEPNLFPPRGSPGGGAQPPPPRFRGASQDTCWGPTEGTIWDGPVGGSELESRHSPRDSGGWTATSGGERLTIHPFPNQE